MDYTLALIGCVILTPDLDSWYLTLILLNLCFIVALDPWYRFISSGLKEEFLILWLMFDQTIFVS